MQNFDPEQVKRVTALANTPAGKALLEGLMKSRQSQLENAAQAGNAQEISRLVQEFLSSEEGAALKRQLEGQ